MRPCPSLVRGSPQLELEYALVLDAQEAQELQEAGHEGRITHFDLPEHEQLAMC
ncbi:hypothetical protein ACFVJH_34095 [Streptomyces decoyicus]|uniref:hypothetical protein n=1 Tax=Streptomyces decoyicus TaxID=249567 RepID=UPI00362EC4CA